MIPFNPAIGIKKPKSKKKEIVALDLDQAMRLLAATEQDRMHAYFVLAIDTGMRPGELLALQWTDIILETGTVAVRRFLEDRITLRVKDVKTAKGRRSSIVCERSIEALIAHRQRMAEEGLSNIPVFCKQDGAYMRQNYLRRFSLQPALERAGLPRMGLYSLRHTSSTLLFFGDTPAKVVGERMGHSTTNLTIDTDSHVLPTMQKDAATKMGNMLAKEQSQKPEVAR